MPRSNRPSVISTDAFFLPAGSEFLALISVLARAAGGRQGGRVQLLLLVRVRRREQKNVDHQLGHSRGKTNDSSHPLARELLRAAGKH